MCARKVYCGETAHWIRVPFGVVSGVDPGIHELDEVHVSQEEGAVSGMVSGIFWHLRPIRLNERNDVLFAEKCIQLVCEKLTIFPYGQYIVGIYVSFALR